MTDPYATLTAAAHSGAFGLGNKRAPTAAQVRAGNYQKGSLRLHGLAITIETPMFTPRTGKADGEPWSIVCMANYGYLNGCNGADGDAFDVYVGPVPESTLVVVVNQVKKDRSFDEHKAVLGFHDVDSAILAYRNSYEQGWKGLGSYVTCSVKQFKAWLKSGDLTRPLEAADLIQDEVKPMTGAVVAWGEDNLPVGMTLGEVLYGLRRSDPEKLLLDSASMADITELLSDGNMLDAMVIEYAQFERKANQLLRVMQAAAATVKVDAVEVSKPFKNRGTTQVAMLFTMSDGQSVSVFFHNPDSTPNRLTSTDELISWKWVLNKKDITLVVAPERGQDISPRQVARRIMTLVEKNSAKFIKASGASAESAAKIEALKTEVQNKAAELQGLDEQIAELQSKVAKLPASIAEPDAATVDVPAKANDYAQQYLAKATEVAEKIKALGGAPLTQEEFMAQVASGDQNGFTMEFLAGQLAEHKASLDAVRAGKKSGRSIVGKGGTKKSAMEWLTNAIAETQAALDSGGIMASVNASNYLGNLSEMLRSLEAQQAAGEENQDNQPVPQIDRTTWDEGVTQGVADLLGVDYGDASGVVEVQHGLMDAQYLAGASVEAAAQTIFQAATGDAQSDMLGDDPALRDNRTDLEKLTAALVAGNVMGALGVLDAVDDVDALRELVLKAGFSLAKSGTKDEILAGIGRDLVRAAKAKVDGFGLRELNNSSQEAAQEAASAAQQANAVDGDDLGEIEPEGRENTVKTAKGTKVVTGFKVIDAKNLIISHESDGTANPEYPSELQPRDRARATSQAWVQKTARNLDPDSLGRTNRADSGAPIVGKDRVVESGNGRAMAIREAYRIGQAEEYRQWLLENAEYFQVSASRIESMKAPVLVRVRVSAVDRAEFAVEANQDDKLAMTATEKARSDAKRLDTAMLAKLVDGDLTSAANRDFVSAFLQSLGDAEAAQYMTNDGRPTASLIRRLQAALFAGAYLDDRLLELTADSSKPEIANIVSALNMAAPDFMRAKELDLAAAEAAGEKVTDSLELSLDQEAVNAIISATNVLRKAKDSGLGLDEFLRQGDMFGDVDPSVAAMAMFISKNNRSAKRLGAAFKAMAQFVESEARRKQTAGLFGDEPARFADIVKAANAELEKEFGEGVFAIEQNDLFSQPEAQAADQANPDEKETALQTAKAYLDSIIDGTADLSDPDGVMKELERIYAAFGEGELSGLFADAAEAYSQHALQATAEAF